MTSTARKRLVIVCSAIVAGLVLLGLATNGVLGLGIVETASFVQTTVTLGAIAVGGVFAYYKLDLFREFQPHLTISQEVTHRKLGNSYIHVSVTATLSNNSRVAVEIRQADFRIRQMAPFDDSEIGLLFEKFIAQPNNEKYIPFPGIFEYSREWETNELIIEPGEIETEIYEFVVRDVFTTVSIDSFFVDTTGSEDLENRKGWASTSIYDIQ